MNQTQKIKNNIEIAKYNYIQHLVKSGMSFENAVQYISEIEKGNSGIQK